MTGTLERDEECVFLFVREKLTVYLYENKTGGKTRLKEVDAAFYLLMLLLIVRPVGCHVAFYDVCFDAFISP